MALSLTSYIKFNFNSATLNLCKSLLCKDGLGKAPKSNTNYTFYPLYTTTKKHDDKAGLDFHNML